MTLRILSWQKILLSIIFSNFLLGDADTTDIDLDALWESTVWEEIDEIVEVEGEVEQVAIARVPTEIDRYRVSFEQGDAMFLRNDLGKFNIVLMANLIDRLPCPKKCLDQLADLIYSEGQLIIASPCTWMEDYTPKEEWLGGSIIGDQSSQTLDRLKEILCPSFELHGKWDIPFLIREHARKYQWSVAMATRWIRR